MSGEASSISPINKLPLEILSKILLTLAGSLTVHGYPSHGFARHAIQLSSVCALWRQTINSIPTLWNSLEFMKQGQSLSELRYIYLCLERSRNAPVHLRIGRMNFECPLLSMNVELSTLIHSISPRLRSLAIAFARFELTKEILGVLDAIAPNTLHELALYATSGAKLLYADSQFLPQESLDRVLSALRYLSLDSISLDWNTAYMSCRNLVELQLIEIPMNGYPTSLRLTQLLEGNKCLRSIKFSRFELRDYTIHARAAIELPELRHLEMNMHPKFIAWFFGLPIKTSSNLSLWLRSYQVDADTISVKATLNSFFNDHSVTSLCIWGDWLPFSSVARNLQHLETLRIYGHYLRKQVFEEMDEAASFLPHLRTIDIVDCIAQIDDIEPGFRTLLSIPSVRDIGLVGTALYAQRFSEQSLLDMDTTKEWLAQGNVNARISDSSQTDFFAFVAPLR